MCKPLVSVIIPSYNHEKYVQDTIKSIVNQTYKNIELIIIDDGSKDSTWQKIQEMQKECESRFARVHFETKENEGTCATFNKLLSLAQGEYVYIIASDDLAKPHAIEKEVEFLQKNKDYALVVGDNELIDGEGKVCYWDQERNNVYSQEDAIYKTFGEFLQKNRKFDFETDVFGTYQSLCVGNYITNGYLIRKSIFEKTGYFTKEAPLEDWYLMLQISKYAKMKYLSEVLFSYRWHDNNTIKNVEKMDAYAKKTLEYESKVFENIDETSVFPEIVNIKYYGLCYKKIGIPYLFEILSYRKVASKTKIFKLFNIPIFKYSKNSY